MLTFALQKQKQYQHKPQISLPEPQIDIWEATKSKSAEVSRAQFNRTCHELIELVTASALQGPITFEQQSQSSDVQSPSPMNSDMRQ